MPVRPPVFEPRGDRRIRQRIYDQARGSARQRGYDAAWDREAATYKRLHPLCEYCLIGALGETRTTPTELVDHLYPHRGDRVLFWRTEWWVASCTACHSGPKQAAELQGQAALDRLALTLGRRAMGGGGGSIAPPLG